MDVRVMWGQLQHGHLHSACYFRRTDLRIVIPPQAEIQAEQCLLAVRGSGYAVLFFRHGFINEEALLYPTLKSK